MWIVLSVVYVVIGGMSFFLVSLSDEFNPRKKWPTILCTVVLWPLVFVAWGIAALVHSKF